MTLNLRMPDSADLKPKITVFGVGGAGGNAVNNMIEKALEGADFVVANTDAQALQQSKAISKLQLGEVVTEGLGAGARPEVGAKAAEESIERIVDHLAGSHMCFITAGMGGGTGTGAAPIIAQAAREMGILTVGVVTKPFQFEGAKRMRQAEEGAEALQKVVDTLIIIPNQNLFRIANEKTTFTEAFSMADDVLYQGVKGVTDLMVRPGIINLDFADVRSVMDEMGKAMMGTGEATGEDRAIQAAEKAIANPLLDEISLRGAKGVLINVTGGHDLTLFELDEAANRIREEVDPDANIIVGSTLDTGIEGVMRVSVVATGIDADESGEIVPAQRRPMKAPLPMAQDYVEDEVAEVALEDFTESEPEIENIAAYAPVEEEVAEVSEPSLFDLDPVEEVEEEIPAALYQPAPEPVVEEVYHQPAASYTPTMPRPGAPSAETLARLRAAVNNPPAEQPAAPSPALVATPPAAEKSGFGINSLISRMTGGAERPAHHTQTPPLQSHRPEPDGDDRIEIPAFLRRQAN